MTFTVDESDLVDDDDDDNNINNNNSYRFLKLTPESTFKGV